MAEDTTEDLAPRKGKSNAILTYELLAEFDRKLTSIGERAERGEKDVADHETRIRSLERDVNAMIAGAKQGTTQLGWVWVVVVFVANLIVSAISIFVGAYRIH